VSAAAVGALVADALGVLPAEARAADLEEKLRLYLERLLVTNANINLVSRKNTLEHVGRFTRECLLLARCLQEDRVRLAGDGAGTLRLLDLGSGGGFPGMVLKLALPEVEVQLLEGTRKKAGFLAEVAEALELRGLAVRWGRAEDAARPAAAGFAPGWRRAFHWVTGKALGSLKESTRLAEPFLRPDGAHWTFKGAACQAELQAASGLFRQRGFAPLRVERLPGEPESWIVGIRRLMP
jgi:16S rRNA (guanine(527)-N(7))-methyltransferase RsmG